MSKFTLNIKEINDYIYETKRNLSSFEENLELYIKNIINFDTVWNDYNTQPFINKVKQDNESFIDFYQILFNYIKIMEDFCDNIKQIFSKNFNITYIQKINYNLSEINKMILIFNSCDEKMQEINNIYQNLYIPSNFKYYNDLKQCKTKINLNKSIYLNMKNKLLNVKEETENLVLYSKKMFEKYKPKYISKNVVNYSYKIYNINSKEVK